MNVRKLQLIAGTTYTVSLPKEWVKTNSLKEKDAVSIQTNDDNSLQIYPTKIETSTTQDKFTLNIDKYGKDIDQVLFSLYYAGFETITLISQKTIPDEIQAIIKKTLTNMSGTEIVYEDKTKIQLKVLLDKDKLDINQIFFRIALIIGSSVDYIAKGTNKEMIAINENEVDRLYHLASKILFLSTHKPSVLKSANVTRSSNITPYFLIAKKLENIADIVYKLSPLVKKDRKVCSLLTTIANTIKKSINYLIGKQETIFKRTENSEIETLQDTINTIRDVNIRMFLLFALRYTTDIEGELINISFYRTLNK